MVYRIRDWDRHFENSSSRKLKRLDWVAIPNKTDGEGYTALVDHPNAAAHLGAWYAIIEAASKQTPRGMLPGGIPHDVNGMCRSLGRMSRLPAEIFREVIPRLVDIGWLECLDENKQVAFSLAESADALAESASRVAESADVVAAHYKELQGTTGKRKDTHTEARAPDRFAEWIAPWPRVRNPNAVCQAWLSCVETSADETGAFAARERYLASDEVARGVYTDPGKWLMEQKNAGWGGRWPRPIKTGKAAGTVDRVLARMEERIANGEEPL